MVDNIDYKMVVGFGEEWDVYDQMVMVVDEYCQLFDWYFVVFLFVDLLVDVEGFDLGCGLGCWVVLVVFWVGVLYCIDLFDKVFVVVWCCLVD